MGRRAFTLIELLVVIAVIAVALFFVLPLFRHRHITTREHLCQIKLYSIGVSIQSYMTANNDIMPQAARMPSLATEEYPPFAEVMADYFIESDGFKCRADNEKKFYESKGSSYEYNWHLGGKPLVFRQPGAPDVPVMFDHEPFRHRPGGKDVSVNCLRADGSVEAMSEVPDIGQE